MARAHLGFLEWKEKLYPLKKKKKIYQNVIDTATLIEHNRMKKLITTRKTDQSSPLFDSSDSDFDFSTGFAYIDSRRDSVLEAELNLAIFENAQVGDTRIESYHCSRVDKLDEKVNGEDI